MKRIAIVLSFILATVTLFLVIVNAHGGRTDGSGGHYDRNTGEYHYHHGYPAHSHYDKDGDGTIDCPYDFKDKTDHSNHGSSSEDKKEDKTGIIGLIMLGALAVFFVIIAFIK